MKYLSTISRNFIVLPLLVAPVIVHATNGLFLNAYGARSAAMGGVGIAFPLDAITATHVNPAGTAFLENRFDMGALILNPQRRAQCCAAPDGQVSAKSLFVIPNMGLTYKYNEKISLSAGMIGLGGGRTHYTYNFFDTADSDYLGIKLEIGEMNATISYKLDAQNAVAISPLIVAQRFAARGLAPFKTFSNSPDHVTNNGHDWSFGLGVRLGWQGRFLNDKLFVGAMYTPKVNMTEFDRYRGLFANNGEFDIPENYGIGIAYKPNEKLLISFDWQRTEYNELKSVGNASLPISPVDGDPRNLGRSSGPGFGWKDQNVYKLGIQYKLDEIWTLMAGFNYGASPIPDEDGGGELEFNVLAPATTEKHLSAGAAYTLNSKHEFTATVWHAFLNEQSQVIPSGTGLPFEDQTISIEMRQYAIEMGYTYKY